MAYYGKSNNHPQADHCPPLHRPLTTNPHQLKKNVIKLRVEQAPEPVLKIQRVHQ